MRQKIQLLIPILLLFHSILFAQIDSSDVEGWLRLQSISNTKVKDGVFVNLARDGKGNNAKRGDYLKLRYKGKLLNGTVFDESPDNEPFVFQLGYGQVIKGWDAGLTAFQVGSKGDLYVAPNMGYGNAGVGNVAPNSALHFEIEVLAIMDAKQYDSYMVDLEQRERKAFEEQMATQFKTDKKLINDYALDKKIKTKRSESGLTYAVTKPGKGPMPKKGDTLRVFFEGYLLDGKTFDSNIGKEVFSFALGTKKVIDGWDEGLQFFNKDSEGWLMIPSKLAYGNTPLDDGKTIVPANAVLIFKIIVKDIIPKK